MKNIQIIDAADNCAYDVFAATDSEFELIFGADGRDIEFIEDLMVRDDALELDQAFSNIWKRRLDKKEAQGVHGTVFYELLHKKKFYPNNRESDLDDSGGRAILADRPAGAING